MPTIYQYLGITFVIYPNDHNPIHVHAVYQDVEVAVYLYEKDGVVFAVEFVEKRGKLSASKMRDLKMFVYEHKNALLFAYHQIKAGVKFQPITITKRLK